MICKKSKLYTKPEIEFYVMPAEQGYSATTDDGDKDNDFEYGDGGDAW